jgi:hypothetical protein
MRIGMQLFLCGPCWFFMGPEQSHLDNHSYKDYHSYISRSVDIYKLYISVFKLRNIF